MADPVLALVVAGLVLAAMGAMVWPKYGYFWRWQRVRRLTGRVLIEDALKHLYNFEYRKQTSTVESLAGALGVTGGRATDLLVRIEALGMIKSDGDGLRLTPGGRNYALRILRVHRLWEHYLAEETGLAEADWHGEAEEREHDLSPEEIDHLAEQMGYPVYDPHGDPIPTASGDIVPRQGRSLAALPVGELATIVHIEDEPETVYAQLVAEGLHLGARVELTEISPERIRFWADGEEHVLAPILAANLSVVPFVAEERVAEEAHEALSSLKLGETGKVVRISRGCRGLERRRLMDLGILPGTLIEAEMRSPTGDPTAYRIRGSSIALRKVQANHIHINTVKGEELRMKS
jgi:DtxR family Mn-dependent transcriptional regulator